MWDFKCLDPEGRDLCFNGGTCAVSNETGEEYCVCPPGFTHDLDWFHFPNCVSDVNSSKYFFIQYEILAGLLSLVFLKFIIFDLRSRARQIAALAFGFVFLLLWFVLSFYVQGGCYEGCAVFANIAFLLADYCIGLTIVVVMHPLFLMQNESFKVFQRAIWSWTHLFAVGVVCSGVTMLITCREADLSRFNAAALSSTAFLWIGGVCQISFTLVTTFKLKQKLARTAQTVLSSNNEAYADKSKGFIRRIRTLQILFSVILVPFATLLIAVPIILVHFSSFPYFYVIEYMEIEISLVFALAVLLFLKQSNNTISSSKDRPNSTALSVSSRPKALQQTQRQSKELAVSANRLAPLSGVKSSYNTAHVDAQDETAVVSASDAT